MKQWWRMNWRWLLVLPCVFASAVYFASGRLINVYWQEHPSSRVAVQPGEDGPKGRYTSTFVNSGTTYERAVDVTFLGAHPVDTHEQLRAVPGTTLWEFDFSFSADPGVVLQGCHLTAFDSAGRKYFQGAATERRIDAPFTPVDCVPAGAEGPRVDVFSGAVTDSDGPRPENWQSALVIALPDGVSPARVQLIWDAPHYIEFPVGK